MSNNYYFFTRLQAGGSCRTAWISLIFISNFLLQAEEKNRRLIFVKKENKTIKQGNNTSEMMSLAKRKIDKKWSIFFVMPVKTNKH